MIELIELSQLEGRKKRRKKLGRFFKKKVKRGVSLPPMAVKKAIKRKKVEKKIPIAKPSIPYREEAVTPEYEEERPVMEQEEEATPEPEIEERQPEEEITEESGGEAMEGIEIYGLDGLDKSLWQRIKAIGKRIEKKVVRPAIQKVAPTEEGEIPAFAPEQPKVIPQVEEGISKYLPYILIGTGLLVLIKLRSRSKLSEYNDYGCGC